MMAALHSIVQSKKLFTDINSPSNASMGGKEHLLLVVEDSNDYAWIFFLKEKSELEDVVMSLLKDLKTSCSCNVRYVC